MCFFMRVSEAGVLMRLYMDNLLGPSDILTAD